jgi:hypothetical protein
MLKYLVNMIIYIKVSRLMILVRLVDHKQLVEELQRHTGEHTEEHTELTELVEHISKVTHKREVQHKVLRQLVDVLSSFPFQRFKFYNLFNNFYLQLEFL